jgi:SAM-dependent methyltransferase
MIKMKECEIRPEEVLSKYLELSLEDGKTIQKQSEAFIDIACPGCGSNNRNRVFLKNGFHIQLCADCGSLYCSPRPSERQLKEFYEDAPSSRYWAEVFFPAVAKARQEKLFKPKAKAIYDLFKEKHVVPQTICDVGAGYGLLLEELSRLWPGKEFYAVEPSKKLSEVCKEKKFKVLECVVEDALQWENKFDFVTCFEVIEHVFDPLCFVKSIYRLVKPGGFCLMTGLCGDGFDIQVLGPGSKSVFPPHHINFLSIKGLETLFKKAGFGEISITTPGKLDVDIVNNAFINKDTALPLFVETLINRGRQAQDDFQKFLVNHQLSSHVWVLAKKIHIESKHDVQ